MSANVPVPVLVNVLVLEFETGIDLMVSEKGQASHLTHE